MKLLLTSGGLTNQSIISALHALVEQPFAHLSLAFIPTAANVEEGDKWWLVEDMKKFSQLRFKSFDVVDISALPVEMWEKRLTAADILVFGGGNTFHLKHEVRTRGLEEKLPELLKTRIYVGISAGSMITTPDLMTSASKNLYERSVGKEQSSKGMGFVPFYFLPHLNSRYFPHVREEKITTFAKEIPGELYAIDDQTAIQVVDDKIEVISEGMWKKFN